MIYYLLVIIYQLLKEQIIKEPQKFPFRFLKFHHRKQTELIQIKVKEKNAATESGAVSINDDSNIHEGEKKQKMRLTNGAIVEIDHRYASNVDTLQIKKEKGAKQVQSELEARERSVKYLKSLHSFLQSLGWVD